MSRQEGDYYRDLVATQKENEEQKQDTGVETGSISTLERRNSLEKHLQVNPQQRVANLRIAD